MRIMGSLRFRMKLRNLIIMKFSELMILDVFSFVGIIVIRGIMMKKEVVTLVIKEEKTMT